MTDIPPILVRADELLIFESVAQAESSLEPVDGEPDEIGFDARGRSLHVLVRGEVKGRWVIDQSPARVEIVAAKDEPTHSEGLRALLVDWLGRIEGVRAGSSTELPDLVERARKYAYRSRCTTEDIPGCPARPPTVCATGGIAEPSPLMCNRGHH